MVAEYCRGLAGGCSSDLRCDQAIELLGHRAKKGERETSWSEASVWYTDFSLFSLQPLYNTSAFVVSLMAQSLIIWASVAIFLRLGFGLQAMT